MSKANLMTLSYSNKFKQGITRFFHHRFDKWLLKRIPASEQHQLTQNNIFIFPSAFGFSYLMLIVVLFLLATNYQNNIIMLFSYIMASLFLTVMMTSFFNMSGLIIKAKNKTEGFAGQLVFFDIELSTKFNRYDLTFSFDDKNKQISAQSSNTHLSCIETGLHKTKITFYSDKRGRIRPGRLKISSEYCFGLFITWTQLDFDFQGIIYPKIRHYNGPLPKLTAQIESNDSNAVRTESKGDDDFYELKNFIIGEPLSRVAWKQLAKGQGKFTKHYRQSEGSLSWLSFQNMPVNGVEAKLELLCFFIVEFSKTGRSFGLDLGEYKISPAVGRHHKHQCLTALADFKQVLVSN